ncbi:MAG: SAM-dependent methyltransferase [Pseudonocardiaceae bacterium]
MSIDLIIGTALRLNTSLEALAALGARLRLLADDEPGHPAVTPLLDGAIEAMGLGQALQTLSPEQARAVADGIRSFFLQAADLQECPQRAPGWVFDDPAVLQSQGQASSMQPALIASCAPQLDGLAQALAGPDACFLDIGSGVAAQAIAACRQWPAVRVVGVDPFAAAVALARSNIAAAGLDSRIELREQGIEDLTEEMCFDLAWMPVPFMPGPVLPVAVKRTLHALRPGGWAILGLYAGPDDPLSGLLTDLRTVRSGGQALSPEQTAALLTEGGFAEVSVLPRPSKAPMQFVAGRRPGEPVAGSD